jgi:antitoxin ParD1/3/4
MPSVSIGDHFEQFVQRQITCGRYQNASEVVRAGLRLLEDYETTVQERAAALKAKIDEAWDDPSPSRPAGDVFGRIETLHSEAIATPPKPGASSRFTPGGGSRSVVSPAVELPRFVSDKRL